MADYPKDHQHECPSCRGTGEVVDQDAEGFHYTDCETCKGAGQLPYRENPRTEREVPPPHDHVSAADQEAAKQGSKG
jgi:DnaJ-class molecular chaperone